MTDSACEACRGDWPLKDHFIADFGLVRVFLHDDQFFPGWTIVLLKRHATELFHLAATERFQLMEEVNQVAKILAHVFEAKKMNYELLGNRLSHIHWHLIPRLAGDPAPVEPVWGVSHEPLRLASKALQERIRRIQAQLRP
jgi:diadenosine tetraphosphate (Ap4A) HIT family hydrolase